MSMRVEHNQKYYTCKRMRMLSYLREKGFMPVEVMNDPYNPRFLQWNFENTPELQEVITEYFEQLKK